MSLFTGISRARADVQGPASTIVTAVSDTTDPAIRLAQLAQRLERPALLSVDLPLDALSGWLSLTPEGLRSAAALSWERPADGLLLAGFGMALELEGERSSTLADSAPAIRDLCGASIADTSVAARPRFFVGARFAPGGRCRDASWDPFGGWRVVVPRLLIASEHGRLSATLTAMVNPGQAVPSTAELLRDAFRQTTGAGAGDREPRSEPASRAEWEASVDNALSEIRAGRYEKTVLARMQAEELRAGFDRGRILGSLAANYQHCFIFSFGAGDLTWLGASPELLASCAAGNVQAASLAGSRPRGADSLADARLAEDLMASAKERSEHAFVGRAITSALEPLCDDVSAPETPSILRMPNIQHLYTPVTARLTRGYDLLDVVTRLHPTPAVGGWPREQACDAIERLEGMDRGWYAGPIGWIDLDGDGEFAVGLRAALVGRGYARLYAGAGIVDGSRAAAEYAETETKLRPLREALELAPGVA